MDGSVMVVMIGILILVLDFMLYHFHWARVLYARLAGRIPRWMIWLTFLFSVGTAAHLASVFAMIALMVAIATFGFVMLAWQAAADRGPTNFGQWWSRKTPSPSPPAS